MSPVPLVPPRNVSNSHVYFSFCSIPKRARSLESLSLSQLGGSSTLKLNLPRSIVHLLCIPHAHRSQKSDIYNAASIPRSRASTAECSNATSIFQPTTTLITINTTTISRTESSSRVLQRWSRTCGVFQLFDCYGNIPSTVLELALLGKPGGQEGEGRGD